jgi:hypothetical protein
VTKVGRKCMIAFAYHWLAYVARNFTRGTLELLWYLWICTNTYKQYNDTG